ncbi:MAG: RNA polymerase sigma factor [Candidatus Zixiibacteriota bacterium]
MAKKADSRIDTAPKGDGSRVVAGKVAANETIKAKDFALMRRIQAGDMVAFNDMVNNYKDRLMNVIGRMLSSQEEAEDVVQEAFVRVFQHRQSFDFKHCFSTWIYTIALNLARNELRRRKRFKFQDIFDMQGNEAEISVEMKLPSMIGQSLEREIQALPEKYKSAFLLRDIQEMSYEEVAQVMSVPLGTVKSRVNRARAILREKLAPKVEERDALSKATLLATGVL